MRVLVLGGGSGQIPLLRRLAGKGVQIVLQDRNPACPGRSYADIFVPADTVDSEAAARIACEYRVDGVLTAGTDQPVLAAAVASEARGCPALHSPDTAHAVTDKEVMKKALTDSGIPVPEYRIVGRDDSAKDLSELSYPRVVKPVDSQGQRGVVRIDSDAMLDSARINALRFSRRGKVIVEAYHQHREVTVSGWAHRGNVRIWAVTDRVTRDFLPHIGLCISHRYPSAYAAGHEAKIIELTHRCTSALGIREGPIYYQFLVTAYGVLVNECAARLGGAYEDISLPPVCGNDPLELLIAGTLAGAADPGLSGFRKDITAGSFAVPLMFCYPGRIARQNGEAQILSLPGVTDFAFLQAPGTLISSPKNSLQRAAYLVVHGNKPSEVNRILRRALPRISITDSQGRQVLRNPLGYALNPI